MKVLVIGNLTKDIIKTRESEKVIFGGCSSYGSITAIKLNCETHLLSRGDEEIEPWIEELKKYGIIVNIQRSENTTCFMNDYTEKKRKQYVFSDAGKIEYKSNEKFDIIHIGPVFNEITLDCLKNARRNSKLLSLDVQGFVRSLKNKKVIDKFWEERDDFLKYVDLVKVSQFETNSISRKESYEDVCKEILDLGVKVVEITFGENGSIIVSDKIHRIPAYKTKLIDKTGSGDVFTTAFAVRYLDTNDPMTSGLFASAAASFVVEDFGSKNIKDKNNVLERFRELRKVYDKSDNF